MLDRHDGMADASAILNAYREASRSEPAPSSLVALIRRYNLPWFGPPCLTHADAVVEVKQPGLQLASRHAVLCYESLLGGDEENPVLPRVRQLAALPQFYRLNWIRQLSTTSLAINLDGNHNRLSHSLGTLDIASRFVRVLQRHLNPTEVKAILVYAFIHDCFHGPMGHTLDLIKDVIWGPFDERIDKHLLLHHIEEGLYHARGFLWRAVLEHVADKEDECSAIFRYLEAFLTPDAKRASFLAEIVDSDLDADRLDYIWRDYSHLMLGSFDITQRQVEKLLESMKVIEEPKGETHIYFDAEQSEVVEHILDLRVRFYTRFYEHPIKTVADEMLTHAIYYLLQGEGMLDDTGAVSSSHKGFAEQFSYLTDDGLFHLLTELTSKDMHIIPYALFQDLCANRPFEIVYQEGLKRENFVSLTRRAAALNHAFEAIQREEGGHIRSFVENLNRGIFNREQYEAILARYNERACLPLAMSDKDPLVLQDPKTWLGVELPYTGEDDLYRIQFLYSGSFRKKILLERLLWRTLQDGKVAFESALGRVALALAASRSGDQKYVHLILSLLRRTPLIFINLSWMPGITDQALRNHKRGFSPEGLRFHRSGRPFKMEAELTVKSRDTDYYLTICAPRLLLRGKADEDDTLKNLIVKTFNEFLKRREWLVPQALEHHSYWDTQVDS